MILFTETGGSRDNWQRLSDSEPMKRLASCFGVGIRYNYFDVLVLLL